MEKEIKLMEQNHDFDESKFTLSRSYYKEKVRIYS